MIDAAPSKLGSFDYIDCYDLSGGINLVDSPFKIPSGQAVGGQNWDYIRSGGIRKRGGHSKINAVANSTLKSLGLKLYQDSSSTRFPVRVTDSVIQSLNTSVPSFTNLTEDTTAVNSTFATSGSTVPAVFAQFNTSNASILWTAGAGMSKIYGVYSSTKVTANGVDAPGGSISTSVNTSAGGSFASTGTYRYAVAFRKLSTQAISNAAFSQTAAVANTGDTVTINLTSITGLDTTKHDKFYIYRSAVSGVADFTAGDLIAIISSSSTTYEDLGSFLVTATPVPRVANTVLDNSPLPAGTYKALTVFKRRLIAASGSTIYASDLNKPESFPVGNTITIPSGGPITALSVISFTSTGNSGIDEILCVHKENELWVVTGNGDFTDINATALKFIDNAGAVNQSCVVNANGYLFWLSANDVFMWSGTAKVTKISRLVKSLFEQDGDLDKSKLSYSIGCHYQKQDLVIWYLSHKVWGEQKFQLKLDLKNTLKATDSSLSANSLDACFIPDRTESQIYAADSYLDSTSNEVLILGDASGFIYSGYTGTSDAGSAIMFSYTDNFQHCGNPNLDKRFAYVAVWVEEVQTHNLTLDWWTNFRTADARKSTRALPLSTAPANALALWDVAYWDEASWDDYSPQLKPLWFALSPDQFNTNEGKAIKLQFRQEGVDEPVTILGYTIFYTKTGLMKSE